MKIAALTLTFAIAAGSGSTALAKESDFFATAEISAGRNVVPADIIENGIDQDRFTDVVRSDIRLGYDMGAMLVDVGAEIAVYPEDSRFHRYAFGPRNRKGVGEDGRRAGGGGR